jgi:hypothetical protein
VGTLLGSITLGCSSVGDVLGDAMGVLLGGDMLAGLLGSGCTRDAVGTLLGSITLGCSSVGDILGDAMGVLLGDDMLAGLLGSGCGGNLTR